MCACVRTIAYKDIGVGPTISFKQCYLVGVVWFLSISSSLISIVIVTTHPNTAWNENTHLVMNVRAKYHFANLILKIDRSEHLQRKSRTTCAECVCPVHNEQTNLKSHPVLLPFIENWFICRLHLIIASIMHIIHSHTNTHKHSNAYMWGTLLSHWIHSIDIHREP